MTVLALVVQILDPTAGTAKEQRFTRSPVRIGRNPGKDLCLSFGFVSSWHAQIEFDAPGTMMVLNVADVDRRLTGSNDELAKLNEHIVVKYLAHNAKQDVVNRVKAAIIDGLCAGDGGLLEALEELQELEGADGDSAEV